MRNATRIKQPKYWIIGEYNGRPFRLGPHGTEEEANAEGYEKLPCSFDVISATTSDVSQAVREFRKQQLDQTGDLGAALRRGRRTPPDEYKAGRW